MKTLLVTGGAGFIGANFVRHVLASRPDLSLANLDALTYAGNLSNLEGLPPAQAKRHLFIHGDVQDPDLLARLFREHDFSGVVHFAAESHVDRSILDPMAFVRTNVLGTVRLLEAALASWEAGGRPAGFRFLHVSTDEVYGSLGPEGLFSEETPYDPSSPYSASKAAADHFVRAWHRTYGLPVIVTNSSNNFGPYQFPEKLIPLMILHILEERELPIYGDGRQVRDWVYVLDHCRALTAVLERGRPGETYNIGAGEERENIETVRLLCDLLDRRLSRVGEKSSRRLIRFVSDRPGHDRRYAIDAGKLRRDLGWQPDHPFEQALADTVDWYLSHRAWVDQVRSGEYRRWLDVNYRARAAVKVPGAAGSKENA